MDLLIWFLSLFLLEFLDMWFPLMSLLVGLLCPTLRPADRKTVDGRLYLRPVAFWVAEQAQEVYAWLTAPTAEPAAPTPQPPTATNADGQNQSERVA